MAITVHIADGLDEAAATPFQLAFEPEALFWLLDDAFQKVADGTGQRVTLADDACFRGSQLTVLRRVLADELRQLNARTERIIEVPTTGTVVRVGNRPRLVVAREVLPKPAVVAFLRKLLSVISRARAAGTCVAFMGD